MANPKKKKKEKGGSQSLVLVIFLVLFILVSIGLGVWGYYGYAGQEELRSKANSAAAALKAEKTAGVYWSMLYRDAYTALGEKLGEEEYTQLVLDRDEFLKNDFGPFKDFKNKEAARKLMTDLKTQFGSDNQKDYKSNYKDELIKANQKVTDLEAKFATALKNNNYYEKLVKEMSSKQDEFQATAIGRIDKGNAAALDAARQQTINFKNILASNQDLKNELTKKKEEMTELADAQEKERKQLKKQIANLILERNDLLGGGAGGGGGAVTQRNANELFPLLLDISTGKPLWDNPVGKVIRVDPDFRQVAINIGSAQGARPELSFTVFGASASGRAEKQLKGTIEIIRVVDTNTSLARITSLYDADGREIQLNDLSRNRVVRESEAPIRQDDLLFNLFWGSRVAIAGYVSMTGDASDNPAEQIRQTEDFAHLLQRNGMQVDAYVDLRDGQIRGNLTTKTRYLILGDDLKSANVATKPPVVAAPKEGDEPAKEAPKEEPKEEAKDQPGGDRAKAVNDAKETLKKEAMVRGVLMISAENFATVIGYRRARSANNPEISSFRPTLPYAGSGQGGVQDARPVIQAPNEEKKAPAPEMKEKKDADN